MGITVFKRQIEESAKDTERKNGSKGKKRKSDTWKTEGRENFRKEKVSRVIFCRKLNKMMAEKRPVGLSTSR